jgi:hypothetical protein
MSSSDNDTENQNEKQSLERIIAEKYPEYKIIDHNDEYYVLQKGEEMISVYEKQIKEDIEIYLEKISNFLFIPAFVHKEDYYKIQKKLSETKIKKCAVIISTSHNGGSVKFVTEIVYDKFYMEFIKSTNVKKIN